jgi:hypothetical protein
MSRPQLTFGDSGLPPMPRWVRDLLIGLFVLYVLEALLKNVWPAMYATLAWLALGGGFQPWQLATRYLVQGPGVLSVALGLLALFFTLPTLDGILSRRDLRDGALAVALGGTAFGFALNAIGLVSGAAFGWGAFASAAFCLLGLAMPDVEVRLFFLLPVKGQMIVYGTGVITALLVLFNRDIASADHFGAWLGVLGWWYSLGPGGRRRKLKGAKRPEKEATRFRVVQGGRGNRDDDLIH